MSSLGVSTAYVRCCALACILAALCIAAAAHSMRLRLRRCRKVRTTAGVIQSHACRREGALGSRVQRNTRTLS
ncbi:uncharacterized protein LAESUDRAFT_728868 [Laetiporus sulphureus 93-53]|uniref:Uncharacterized protein n=1 Tax=Laetiporus sulphureus 93-53 TaxID=1314785 RepID=A0A165D052_9APHY|nr:uncharacterized protein LAESUDRAFT_728868 [Laetiporus sulphureus 93-53]KZT03868.1 hypothetical protein LAESUDRAFT_728868 [Laetiporus sulphureus 93-53]